MVDFGAKVFWRDPHQVTQAHHRTRHAWLAVIGFAGGCCSGVACEAMIGLWALVLLAGLE